jgi:hypothetical protein
VELVLVLALSAHLAVAAQAEGSKPYGGTPNRLLQPRAGAARARRPVQGAPSNWKPAFSALEHELGRLLADSDDEIDPAIREQLFRLELELFFAAATLGIEKETAIGGLALPQTSSG